MNLSPAQKTNNRYQFEVFCKKVLRGEYCDYLRQELRRARHEVDFTDLPEGVFMGEGILDDYPSDHYMFETLGYQIPISNDRLGEALSQIGESDRDILLLSYFLDLKDREIGELLKISRSTIWHRRQRLLEHLKEMMKE